MKPRERAEAAARAWHTGEASSLVNAIEAAIQSAVEVRQSEIADQIEDTFPGDTGFAFAAELRARKP